MAKKLHHTKKQVCFVLIASLCFLSGCGFHIDNEIANWGNSTKAIASEAASGTDTVESLKAENSFSPFISNSTDKEYRVNGTIYLSSERALTMLKASDDAEITIKGKLEKVEGDIQLLYKDTEGNTTVLADSCDNMETDISIDTVLKVQTGTGEICFAGNSSVYKFDITFSLPKNVKYYMQNDKATRSMPPRFEIDMTLTKDWDNVDPFIDERLFYVTKDVDSLELNIIFQMKGESGLLEIADNNSDEVLWSNSWNSSVGNTSLTASLKSLQKEKEYVIRFTGTKIEYANIVAASESDLIKERTRPLGQTTEE